MMDDFSADSVEDLEEGIELQAPSRQKDTLTLLDHESEFNISLDDLADQLSGASELKNLKSLLQKDTHKSGFVPYYGFVLPLVTSFFISGVVLAISGAVCLTNAATPCMSQTWSIVMLGIAGGCIVVGFLVLMLCQPRSCCHKPHCWKGEMEVEFAPMTFSNPDPLDEKAVWIKRITLAKNAAWRWRKRVFSPEQFKDQELRRMRNDLSKVNLQARLGVRATVMKFLRGYVFGGHPLLMQWLAKYPALQYGAAFFRGIGQVMFQANIWCGLLMLVACFVGDVWLALNLVLAQVCGSMAAVLLRVPKGMIVAGLYQYNSALVGAAFGVFIMPQWSALTIFASCVGGVFATIMQLAVGRVFGGMNVASLTLPFCIIAFGFCSGARDYSHFQLIGSLLPELPHDSGVNLWALSFQDVLLSVLRSISQVFVINNALSGVIILAGIFVSSRLSAVFALVGACVGVFYGFVLGVDSQEVVNGLWGYNSTLSVMAIAGIFYRLNWSSMLLSLLCGILSCAFFGAMKVNFEPIGMPVFTFPFCFATFTFLWFGDALPDFSQIPLAVIQTPEETMRVYKLCKDTVDRLNYIIYSKKRRQLIYPSIKARNNWK